VTPGYINNDDANAEGFFDGGWFRTGDIGFLGPPLEVSEKSPKSGTWSHPASLAAGPWLTLTGRKKELINRGGEKVSPAEVEAVVANIEEVAEAVCFPMPDDIYGEQVAVALVPAGTMSSASRTELAYTALSACRAVLPNYQVRPLTTHLTLQHVGAVALEYNVSSLLILFRFLPSYSFWSLTACCPEPPPARFSALRCWPSWRELACCPPCKPHRSVFLGLFLLVLGEKIVQSEA